MLPLVLRDVAGAEARANDVLFHPAARRSPSPPTLVFFGGDVQDYEEVMLLHRDNCRYVRWSLQRTARLLATCFPDTHILVIRPARIERKMLSCYDNFVPSDGAGAPTFTPSHGALTHLHRLLQNVSVRLKEIPVSELLQAVKQNGDTEQGLEVGDKQSASSCNATTSAGVADSSAAHAVECTDPLWWVPELHLAQSRVSLVGFSKGCVVLNQIVHEVHHAGGELPQLVPQLCSLYWLEGGHAGGRDTWLTDTHLLHTLASLNVCVYVHVSPYQVRDDTRPWIRREEKIFTHTLTKLGAKISRYFHTSPGPYSLHTHFSVLDNFKQVQDAADTGQYNNNYT